MPLYPTNLNNYSAGTTRPTSVLMPNRIRDVTGRMKVAIHQNIYDADFEYGTQPLRWENVIANTATAGSFANVNHMIGMGGVRMLVGNNSGDLTIRQSRPYMRYQPGKTMFMATAVTFGGPVANNTQRVGFFDDNNGVFFEQGANTAANPTGLYCVIRSDAGTVNLATGNFTSSVPTDTRYSFENWYGDPVKDYIDWTRIQMLWIEYAWYGAGCVRWGTFLNGEPYVLHELGVGNSTVSGQPRQFPWSRTGNLPVRYEQRNIGNTTSNSVFVHYGVSVLVEGGNDEQRGFTYSYGNDRNALRRTVPVSSVRYPVTSVRMNPVAVSDFSGNSTSNAIDTTSANTTFIRLPGNPGPLTASAQQGRIITFTGTGPVTNTFNGRIVSNTGNTITIVDTCTNGPMLATPNSSFAYQIGLANRGQILPQQLIVSADAACLVELIVSTASNPVTLTGASFVQMNTLGSNNSLSQRDISATALTGGEVVYSLTTPSGGSGLQQFDLQNLFSLYNNIRGTQPDILTVAVSTPLNAANVGAQLIAQEAMS